jgi:hypothetical protein
VAQTTSHVSSELCTFRCLVGHVCQRCGPVSHNTVGTMVDVCQVMIVHTIICKIQASRLTTLVSNEWRWRCNCTEILDFLTMKLELPSPLLSDSPFLSSEQFFCFSKSRPPFGMTFPRPCDHKFSITAIVVIEKFIVKIDRKPKTPLLGCSGRKNSKTNIGIHGHTGVTRPVQTHKTPKDLSTHESEERVCEVSVGLYTVCMCERGGWGREGYGLRNTISTVIHT